ncbi:MAG: hypothetical protein RIS43_961, partial [Actinomycetota bacterium]
AIRFARRWRNTSMKSNSMSRSRIQLLAAATLTVLIGYLLKIPCAADSWSISHSNLINLCYSDIGALYYWRGLIDGVIPYVQMGGENYVEYPVLIGILMWLASIVTHWIQGNSPDVSVFVFLTWLSSGIFIVAAVNVMSRIKSRNRNAAWWFALSPAVLFTLGINWDAIAVLFMVLALYAWQEQKLVLTGIAVGLGTAAKLFPALILVVLAIAVWNSRDFKKVVIVGLSSAASWLLVNVPFMILNFEGWFHFYDFSRKRGIDFGSPYLAIAYSGFFDHAWTSTEVANAISSTVMIVSVLAMWFFRERLNVHSMLFILVAVFCLTNKVYSPQYWLWLSPLVILVTRSMRVWIAWNVAQTIYFVAVWRFILGTDLSFTGTGAIDERTYALSILIMWLATAALVIKEFRSKDPQLPAHDQSHL